jgi:two-component system, OmpR family, phosphate regulon response regulator PhoB
MPGDRGSVLIVEDTRHSAELVAALVQAEGFNPVICSDAKSARAAYSVAKPVAILLDWVLPDAPGTELCREMRTQDPTVTIIFVSGRGDETSVSRGLDAGADDFVTKPVRGGELIARLEAHLRRVAALRGATRATGHVEAPQGRYRYGPMEVDLVARRVSVNGRQVKLGPLEFKLVEYLARNGGVAISREQILAEVYGIDADIDTGRVDLLVRRLRLKLGASGALIVAHAGYGYMLEKDSGR